MESFALLLAIGFAIVFFGLRGYPFFRTRPLIKAGMAVCLAVYCYHGGGPALMAMALGFLFSALGDFFLDLPKDRFIAGLAAFFAAHIAFLVYLAPQALPLSWYTAVQYGFVITIAVLTLGFYLWLRPSLDKELRIPVGAYALVIGLMGIAAFNTSLSSILIPLGAALFILSDIVLATERFKFKFRGDKHLNWALYASGQILLAVGVVTSLG